MSTTWEDPAMTETLHGFSMMTVDGPISIQAKIRSYADGQEDAIGCGELTFRVMLDAAGIPWRKAWGSGGSDQEHLGGS